jgi:serine protease Do
MASQTAPGTDVELKIVREGTGRSLKVALGELPGDLAQGSGMRSGSGPGGHDGLDGVVVDELNRDARRDLDVPNRIDGALVSKVDPGSNAYEAGLREGDIIVEINHQSVGNADEAVALSAQARSERILLRVWTQRGGRPGLVYMVVDNTKND